MTVRTWSGTVWLRVDGSQLSKLGVSEIGFVANGYEESGFTQLGFVGDGEQIEHMTAIGLGGN